jgi:hypothetical protein
MFALDMLIFYLYLAVFFAIFFGCFTNCLPFLLPAAFALLVAAFSLLLKDFQAASGKYRFLPLLGFPIFERAL